MLSRLFVTLSFFILLLLSIFMHYFSIDRTTALSQDRDIAKITNIAYPAFKVSWYEKRVPSLESDIDLIYLNMPSMDRLNFTYKGRD